MRTGLMLVLAAIGTVTAFAQSATISGTVLDARTERPLSGVLITVEGLPPSIETDVDGRFELSVPPGQHVLAASLVGFALLRHTVAVAAGEASMVTLLLSEGAGVYEERISVSAAAVPETGAGPAGVALHGRELQALRGVTLDDPFRALHAVPSAAATDDFYSEFAVRGNPFRHVGLVVDGIPTRYLMHAVHGVTDGGSIAMVNSDAVGSVSLMPGSYPQRTGGRLGAEVDLAMREGDRDRFRARVGASGTSAGVLAEGPLKGERGSWLVSARRSYLDMLLRRIDEDGSLAFGFTDTEAKVVLELSPRHQLQLLAIAGLSGFDQEPQGLGANDVAEVAGRSWLSGVTWRFTPSASFAVTHRAYATGLAYRIRNRDGHVLDDSLSAEFAWRGNAMASMRRGLLVEFGADARGLTGRRTQTRSRNDVQARTTISDYREADRAISAYAQVMLQPWSRLTLTSGARVDHWGPTGTSAASPWVMADLALDAATDVRLGTGLYRQFPDLEQVHGLQGGGDRLRPETARHVDVSVKRRIPRDLSLQIAWFARDESDVLWTPGSEPRRLEDGSIQPGRGDAPWINTLDGRARGVEVVVRRDAPSGLSGWAGYAFGTHRYTDAATGETFWGDYDQRHSLSLFGYYRLSNRTTVGAKFRYGSNYPLVGYIGEPPAKLTAPLFGETRPPLHVLATSRNTLRLPAYARLDVRADRTFTWFGRRVTLFAEVANVLDRQNLRNVPYGFDPAGRIYDPPGTLLPIVPSAGFVMEF